jgi:hypothetical protein
LGVPRFALAVAVIVAAVGAWLWIRRAPEPAAKPIAQSAAPVAAATESAATKSAAAPVVAPVKALAKPGDIVVRAGWGSGPNQVGRRHDPESSPEAPMAVTAAPDGSLWILDQVNRRATRWKDGKPAGSLSFGSDAAQDLVFGSEGRALVLDRLADKSVAVYGPDGTLLNSLSLVGPGITEGGSVTGVFTDDSGIYVEREHGVVVQIADASGQSTDRTELIGRPSRDGKLLLQAALADRAGGLISVRAFDRQTQQPAWSATVGLGAPVLHILALDSDKNGGVYVAAADGNESAAPPYRIVDEQLVVVRLIGGTERGRATLPMAPTADETFRPITVADDGTVYVMVPGDDGVTIQKLQF